MDTIHLIIKHLLKEIKDPIIFEIGMHHGSDSIQLIKNNIINSKLYESGKFYGFEPLPSNLVIAKLNLEQNCTDCLARISVFDYAISDRFGFADFYVSSDPENFNGSSSLLKPSRHLSEFPHVKFNEKIKVKTITLDQFCEENKVDHIDFLWCDAQFNEGAIIKGSENILKTTKYFYFETYGETILYDGGCTEKQLLELLGPKWVILNRFPNEILVKNTDLENDNN